MKVNILGEEWKLKYKKLGDDFDGLTDWTNRTITIRKNNINNVGNFSELQKQSLRHEIVHAMLYECGLMANWQHPNEFGHDETFVDWYAIQYPKIAKIYRKLGIEE